jgi:general secretion pathway protein A
MPALPSRREASAACRDALDDGAVLLTGPAGAGKTALLAEIAAESALDWVALDLQPDWAPDDLARAIAAALELDPGAEPRLALRAFLRDEHQAGQRWGLALDEAHLASDDLLEAVRLLSNDRGSPTGFAALVLAGQCPLVRRLMSPRHASLATRLAAHVALRALDRDEAETLLRALVPGLDGEASATIDALYRQTRGVPALLVREGRRLVAKQRTPQAVRVEPARARPAITAAAASHPPRPAAPLLGDDRPPLRVEDHLIEVGWSGADADSGPDPDAEPETAPEPVIQAERALSPSPSPSSEPLDDRYAALQAWHEWARNQGRGTIDALAMDDPDATEAEGVETEGPLDDEEMIWVDPGQSFAPYGRLFQNAGGAPGTSP